VIKPHRLIRDRVTDITAEASAYLRQVGLSGDFWGL